MKERITAPVKALRVLEENYGVPVKPTQISEIVWGKERVSDHDIHTLMTRCRSFIDSDQYLYNLFRTAAYMLDGEHKLGSWLSFECEKDRRLSMLSPEDVDYINQFKVSNDGRLLSRLSKREHELLGVLCELSEDGKYANTGRIARHFYGVDDYCEREGVRRSVHMLKKKIVGLNSILIDSKVNKGYLVRKKE